MPISIGDHIRKRRLKLGLCQRELAQQLGVSPWTILNWEKRHTEPPIAFVPAIVRFLDYDPFPQPKTLAQHLLAKRREMGWSIKGAAQILGVDPGTWSKWEEGHEIRYRKHKQIIGELLGWGDCLENRAQALREVLGRKKKNLHRK